MCLTTASMGGHQHVVAELVALVGLALLRCGPGCGRGEFHTSGDVTAPDTDAPDPSDPPTMDEVMETIIGDRMKEMVYEITSDIYAGRSMGSDRETKKARSYIKDHFATAGLLPGMDGSHEQLFAFRSSQTGNVVGYLPGREESDVGDEIVAVGDRHDHLGPDYPGADDNASGTAMVIELPYALAKLRARLNRTAAFITFTGEERGCIGSSYYCKNDDNVPLEKTVVNINLDMVGLGGAKDSSGLPQHKPRDPGAVYLDSPLPLKCTWDKDVFGDYDVRTTHKWFTGGNNCYHRSCDTADGLSYRGVASRAKSVLQTFWDALQDGKSTVPQDLQLTFRLPCPVAPVASASDAQVGTKHQGQG